MNITTGHLSFTHKNGKTICDTDVELYIDNKRFINNLFGEFKVDSIEYVELPGIGRFGKTCAFHSEGLHISLVI